MNRSVVRSAFGRCRLEANASYPTITPRFFFSTTSQSQADENDGSSRRPASGRQRSAAAASELGSLNGEKPTAPAFRRVMGFDARSLKASPPGPSGVTAKPKIINVRSLRPRGGAARGDGNFPRRDFGPSGGQGIPGRFSGRGGAGARGRGGRIGGGGRGGQKPLGKDRKKEDNEDDKTYKLTWTPEQKEFIQREEQGVVMAYAPKINMDNLAGYMPAIATDSSLTRVGSIMRSMRILGGGRPFYPEGYFNNLQGTVERYSAEKKPVFFDDRLERQWVERNYRYRAVEPADPRTKEAIVQSAIQGKYPAPQFAAVKDTMATLTRYHIKDYSYKPSDGEKFEEKVRSLLPGAGKTAGAKQAKAKA